MDIICELRQKTGLTQAEFARRTGTSQSTITMYESGAKSPTVRTIERKGAQLQV